jgi:Mlc titration factor MtfA (ptsG expression regulator)
MVGREGPRFQASFGSCEPSGMFQFFRRLRHQRIWATPFPSEWVPLLEARFPYVQKLDAEDRSWLEDLIQVFLHDKTFEGAGGLEVTDAMRVSVAAQACLLLLGDEETAVYPELKRIVLYPAAYVATRRSQHGAVVQEKEEVRLGESWDRGVVVLAWNAVDQGARNMEDGRNVVMHEFAHQLDQELGDADGAPELPRGMAYGVWAKALGKEFANLVKKTDAGRVSLLDAYGATSPAEFFAVATEYFFEKPVRLREKKPDLYAQLAAYYRQDPAERLIGNKPQ